MNVFFDIPTALILFLITVMCIWTAMLLKRADINLKILLQICSIILFLLLAWHFFDLLIYVFIAFIFSLIGKPIAKTINRIKIFQFSIPYWLCTLFTMSVFVLCIVMTFVFFVPVLSKETQRFAAINYDDLAQNLSFLLNNVQAFLLSNNLIDQHETLVGLVTNEIKNFANFTNFSNIVGGLMSATGSFLMGVFAVFFLTFFFMKDDIRLVGVAQLFFDEKHADRLTFVAEKINKLLSRYFIGLLIEVVSMITLLYIGMALFGIKGAFLMAFLGGTLNAIPYLGPLIGVLCSCLFGAVDCLAANEYQDILPTVLKIAGTFVAANIIDNIVLQPIIYSRSVKAHPVEIFLVIIMGGSIAGIPGMLFAIPVYTMIRTIIIEIFKYVKSQPSDNSQIIE